MLAHYFVDRLSAFLSLLNNGSAFKSRNTTPAFKATDPDWLSYRYYLTGALYIHFSHLQMLVKLCQYCTSGNGPRRKSACKQLYRENVNCHIPTYISPATLPLYVVRFMCVYVHRLHSCMPSYITFIVSIVH